MATEHDDRALLALYHGIVTDRNDPMRCGRVRVRVNGLIEPESAWAFPLGTMGGGDKNVGFFHVPKVGAEVGVWFCQGDPDFVFYIAGHWGAPNGVPDSPSFLHDPAIETSAEAADVSGYETDRFVFVFDNRAGKESFELRDKTSGDGIAYDSTTRAMRIKSTTAIVIEATGAVSIDGLAVTILGRPVNPGNGPI